MKTANDTFWYINPAYPITLSHWKSDTKTSHAQPSEIIAYHTATGNTHLVTPEGAQILEIIQDTAHQKTADEITDAFRSALDENHPDFDAQDIIESFLTPFKNLGLIETAAQ